MAASGSRSDGIQGMARKTGPGNDCKLMPAERALGINNTGFQVARLIAPSSAISWGLRNSGNTTLSFAADRRWTSASAPAASEDPISTFALTQGDPASLEREIGRASCRKECRSGWGAKE